MRRAQQETKEAIRAAKRKRLQDSRIQFSTPLTDHIDALIRSLSPEQRNRPWITEELVARLHGRYNARDCAVSLGVALRRLGWTRIKDLSHDEGARKVWSK